MKNSQSAEWPEKGLQPTCVCVRSTAMLLLSNSPHCVHGVNTSHLINITVDVMQSNQKVKLSWCYLARVQMLQLCASFHKNMTHIRNAQCMLWGTQALLVTQSSELHACWWAFVIKRIANFFYLQLSALSKRVFEFWIAISEVHWMHQLC